MEHTWEHWDEVDTGRAHSVDLVDPADAHRNARLAVGSPAGVAPEDIKHGDHGLEPGFNLALNRDDRSERIFAFHAKRLGIARLLDVGANCGQFAAKIRRYGFGGVIHSVEPLVEAHGRLRQNAQADVRWIPLPRLAAGRSRGRLELNVAENSWSSSFLSVHENHLRGAPAARTVAHETVCVAKTADLLHGSLMREIDALKIDVQGYELEVIEGLRSCIDSIDLVLLEMSLVECYVGAPDLFAMDRLLVDDLGFDRVSFEPSYYDDQLGVAQQFDGIYVRNRPRRLRAPASADSTFSAVVTSMHGAPSRVTATGTEIGGAWLKLCIQSWQLQAKRIISVSEAAPADARVQWIQTNARPAIAELLAAIPDESNDPAIICNADILIGDAMTQLRPKLDPSTLYIANRIEVEAGAANLESLEIKGYYEWGFDLFVLPAAFVRFARACRPLAEEFRIGEPWWDYLLPLIAVAAGFPVKRLPLDQGIALHYRHPARYEQSTWRNRGTEFMSAIAALAGSSSRDVDLLYDLNALRGAPESVLQAASGLVCSRLG